LAAFAQASSVTPPAASAMRVPCSVNLSPYFMSAFTLEALGRYREAAAEWRYIISWLEAHDDTVHTTWPKEMLEGIEAKLAAAEADAEGAGN